MLKSYDRAYFNEFYRNPRTRVSTRDSVERKVHMAVSVAEFLLGRRIESVLDVGSGEGQWFTALRRMRRNIRYIGVDPSEYVVERFGKQRNIRRGSFGELGSLRLRKNIDLVVCADVLQYVTARDVGRGLRAIRGLMGGVAYIEAYTGDDEMEGDLVDWQYRSAAEYRRMFRRAGLTLCGPYMFVKMSDLWRLNDFEHMWPVNQ